MAQRDILSTRQELFLITATIAAHANAGQAPFRQRDLKFLVELFSNWVEMTLPGGIITFQNTQIARYLSELVQDGLCKVERRSKLPGYRLSRLGLLSLLERVHALEPRIPEQFLFLYYFISNYRERISGMIVSAGTQFPPAMRIEIEALLDVELLLNRELRRVELEIRKLTQRMQDSERSAKYAENQLRRGSSLESIVEELERKFPYDLNSRKPLSELMGSIPNDIAEWELSRGNRLRPSQIWGPSKILHEQYLKLLKQLRANNESV